MSGEGNSATPDWASWKGTARLEDLFEQLGTYAAGASDGLLWRGQSRKSWGISSSLWRSLSPPDESTMRAQEQKQLEVVRKWRLAHNALPSSSEQQVLAVLQHHGAPTRFLDVTSDPLVALWFACDDAEGEDGVVFGFSQAWLKVLMAGDDPLAGGAASWGDVRNSFSFRYESRLTESSETRLPFIVDPENRNDRVRAQGGMFLAWAVAEGGCATYGGLSRSAVEIVDMSPADGERHRSVLKVAVAVVPGILKSRARRMLADSFGVTEARIFPDVQGLADHLRGADDLSQPTGGLS